MTCRTHQLLVIQIAYENKLILVQRIGVWVRIFVLILQNDEKNINKKNTSSNAMSQRQLLKALNSGDAFQRDFKFECFFVIFSYQHFVSRLKFRLVIFWMVLNERIKYDTITFGAPDLKARRNVTYEWNMVKNNILFCLFSDKN